MEEKNTLGFLGTNGQYLIAKALIEDKEFFLKIEKSVNPNVFTDTVLQKIIKIYINRYRENGELLSYKALELLIKATNPAQSELSEFKKVFTISKCFRDEKDDFNHLVEFRILEVEMIDCSFNNMLEPYMEE